MTDDEVIETYFVGCDELAKRGAPIIMAALREIGYNADLCDNGRDVKIAGSPSDVDCLRANNIARKACGCAIIPDLETMKRLWTLVYERGLA